MSSDQGRPNKTAAKLRQERPGRVRPYLRVRMDTLLWLESRGSTAVQRSAVLVTLLRSRYEGRPGPLPVRPEGPLAYRPLLPPELLDALDKERGDVSRGQLVDAIVAAERDRTSITR